MSNNNPLYEPNGRVRLAEGDVYVSGKKHFKADEKINNRSAELQFDAWIDDISKSEKEVFLYISFSFYGSRRREAFWLRDVFSRRINLCPTVDGSYPQKEKYDCQATLELLCSREPAKEGQYKDEPFVIGTVFTQLDLNGLASHKDTFDRLLTRVLTHDLENAFKRWHDDEKNGFLSVKEMSPAEAVEYLPTVFTYTTITFPDLSKEGYKEMLEGSKRVCLCEVSPEGYAYDVFKRMRYAVDSLGYDSKDVFYYAELGEKNESVLVPDGSTLMNNMERHFNVVKHIWGTDPNGVTKYTKAFVGLIIRDS